MQIKSTSHIAAIFLINALTSVAFADYPIVSNRYLADPTTLVTKDRVYIYCSNDDENPTGNDKEQGSFNIPNVVCVSRGRPNSRVTSRHFIMVSEVQGEVWAGFSLFP